MSLCLICKKLIEGLKLLSHSPLLYETPAISSIALYHDQISKWLKEDGITAKQIWRLLKEHYEPSISYTTVRGVT